MRKRGMLSLALVMGLALPATAAGPEAPAIIWSDPQPFMGSLTGAGDLHPLPGDEVLMQGFTGGFFVGRPEGSVLWRFQTPGYSRPVLVGDLDGDGRADVAAGIGYPDQDGELVVLEGDSGRVIRRVSMRSPVGRIAAGDLNADGHLDLVVPSVDGTIKLVALFGPDFTEGWTITLPGTMTGYWVFTESLAVGELDGQPGAEIVFGSRRSANSGGTIFALDGKTGATRWTADTGSVFSLAIVDQRVVAYVWRQAGISFRGELAAYGPSGGAPIWTLPTAGFVKSAPLLVADVDGDGGSEVVIATGVAQEGTMLFGVDPSNQVLSAIGVADGRPRWTSKLVRDPSSLVAVPRAGGGSDVAFGTDAWITIYSDEQVGLISGLTGAPLWTRLQSGPGYDERISGLAVADIDPAAGSEVVYASTELRVTALAPSDGALRSNRAYPAAWTAADAGDPDGDGRLDVAAGGADGLVRLQDEEGDVSWQRPLGGMIGGVRLAGDRVLAVALGSDARITAFDLNGTAVWSVPTGIRANNPYTTHQLAFDDLDGDGIDDVVIGGASNERPSVAAYSGRTGALLWRALSPLLPPGSQPASGPGWVANVGIVDGDVLATIANIEVEVAPRLVRLSGVSGALEWSSNAVEHGNDVVILPLGGKVLVASDGQYLSALEGNDGTQAWSADLGKPHALVPSGDGVIAFARKSGLVNNFEATVLGPSGPGATVATATLPSSRGAALVPNAGIVYATLKGVYVLDPVELGQGNIRVLSEMHLPAFANPNGSLDEAPAVTQVMAASAGSRTFAVGLRDVGLYSGAPGGGVPGAWLARL